MSNNGVPRRPILEGIGVMLCRNIRIHAAHQRAIRLPMWPVHIHQLKRTSVLFSCDGSFLGASFFCEWPFYGAFFFYRKALSDVFNFLLISIMYCCTLLTTIESLVWRNNCS